LLIAVNFFIHILCIELINDDDDDDDDGDDVPVLASCLFFAVASGPTVGGLLLCLAD